MRRLSIEKKLLLSFLVFIGVVLLLYLFRPTYPTNQQPDDKGKRIERALKAFNTGERYELEENFSQAANWYHQAASNGSSQAPLKLAKMYRDGQGVSQDLIFAAHWLIKAIEQDQVEAQLELAKMYFVGESVKQDFAQAAQWYHKAALKGQVDAQFKLSIMYRDGKGVSKAPHQAMHWLKKAAEQGHAEAKLSLKVCSVDEKIKKYLSSNSSNPKPDDSKFSIEDPAHNLDRFFKAVTDLENGKRKKVRVAIYGDSNHTMDWASGSLRTIWGELFGFGGHGFVAAGQPWAWYQHQEINVKHSKWGWTTKAATTPKYKQPYYGHAGILGVGKAKGGFVHFYPQKKGHLMNRHFSQMQVHYLCQPYGGRFGVHVDEKLIGTIVTRCKKRQLKTESFTVELGEHQVKLKVVKPKVLVFGVAFENDQPGIVFDGLGTGAFSLYYMQKMNSAQFEAGLKARNYDLVIFHTGTNMWMPKKHPDWAKTVFDLVKRALGNDVSILVLPPPDFAKRKRGKLRAHPRMLACGKEKQQIALDNNVAFWDYYQAMGGLGSVFQWRKKKWVSKDHIHYKAKFHVFMMHKLTDALIERTRQYWTKIGLGCG